jgi:membrane-associated phospholipid phosphatase
VSKLFFKNAFFIGCVLYFILASIFAYTLGKEESFLIFNRHYNATLGQFYRYYTHIGDGFFIISLVVVLLFIRYYYALLLLACYGIPSIVVQILKRIVFADASRPAKYFYWEKPYPLQFTEGVEVAINNSFPSGHTASAFALFFCLSILIKNQYVRIFFLFLAINSALSRVYLCEHFFTDTLAGAGISFIICIPVIYYLEKSTLPTKLNGSLKLK